VSSNEKKKNLEHGLTCIQVERDLRIGHGTVSKWIRYKKKFQEDAFCGSGSEATIQLY
jgi:hypothetical protein